MNFDKEGSKFEKKMFCVCVCVWRGGAGESTDTKTVYKTVSFEVKYRILQLSTLCRACSKINISKS